jgi:regulator of RNase E activity RraA
VSAGQGSGPLPDLVVGQVHTAVVPDILDDLGHRDYVLDPAIRPLGPRCGDRRSRQPVPGHRGRPDPAEPYAGEIAALDDVRPGEVILVAAGGSARAACWGELFSTAAHACGTLIDGYC